MARKICVFTGTRAEYGHLYWLLKEIDADPRLTLQLLVSGSHLAHALGETWQQINDDGFRIDEKVDMQLGDDSPVGVARAMARGLAGCAEALDRLKPDILVVLGDRYEALAAAEAATLLRIPIAHIHGGEATEGAIDDAMRNAITKLCHLHFPAADEFRDRIIQMGEQPDRVFAVGAQGLDFVARMAVGSRAELERELGFSLGERFLLVTYHPVTVDGTDPSAALGALFAALDRFTTYNLLVTKANADVAGSIVNAAMERYAASQPGRVHLVASLGQRRYLTALAHAAAVVGNSSSGLIEAPVVGTPTVNLGIRQKGRPRAPSVIDCAEDADAITTAIGKALSAELRAIAKTGRSPYGRGGASAAIRDVLATTCVAGILRKPFHALPA
jgi:UDP-hydrolysing UDP-N-acetyl-D-glucosamine 2-epimerase